MPQMPICRCGNKAGHAFDKHECIDAPLFDAARFGLDLRLLEHPIDTIWPYGVKSFDTGDRKPRRVRMTILQNNLVAAAVLNVRGSLSAHASTAF